MTTEDKLNSLYKIKEYLHPITQVLIIGLVETQNSVLKEQDKEFVEDVYYDYFEGK
jgi:hypothetical protein